MNIVYRIADLILQIEMHFLKASLYVAIGWFLVCIPQWTYAQSTFEADFNNDGEVDFDDFNLFVAAFDSSEPKFDLDGNGKVKFEDLILFARLYGQRTDKEIRVILSDSTQIDFAYLPSGSFVMGTQPGVNRQDAEQPWHDVAISRGFYLGKYEVTLGQWMSVMGTIPWTGYGNHPNKANYPVVFISWNDAQDFVQRLNATAGDSLYRLPTEAEWEYACRAGTKTMWWFGDDESNLTKYAWYQVNTSSGTNPPQFVGTKLPNPFGLFDMYGNVWEWCQDWYDSKYYHPLNTSSTDPKGPVLGTVRVRRGGDFNEAAPFVRSAYRSWASPDRRTYTHGFRLVRIAK